MYEHITLHRSLRMKYCDIMEMYLGIQLEYSMTEKKKEKGGNQTRGQFNSNVPSVNTEQNSSLSCAELMVLYD